MEWWTWVILFVAVAVAISARRVNAFNAARAQYDAALAALENDPTNVALRRAALEKGRHDLVRQVDSNCDGKRSEYQLGMGCWRLGALIV
jgi:hypothetical protein